MTNLNDDVKKQAVHFKEHEIQHSTFHVRAHAGLFFFWKDGAQGPAFGQGDDMHCDGITVHDNQVAVRWKDPKTNMAFPLPRCVFLTSST